MYTAVTYSEGTNPTATYTAATSTELTSGHTQTATTRRTSGQTGTQTSGVTHSRSDEQIHTQTGENQSLSCVCSTVKSFIFISIIKLWVFYTPTNRV